MPSQHRAPDASGRRRVLPAPALLPCAKIFDKLLHVIPCRSVRMRKCSPTQQRNGAPTQVTERDGGGDGRCKPQGVDTGRFGSARGNYRGYICPILGVHSKPEIVALIGLGHREKNAIFFSTLPISRTTFISTTPIKKQTPASCASAVSLGGFIYTRPPEDIQTKKK